MEITKQELESLKRLTTDKVAQKILNKIENQSIIVAPEKVISSCCKVLDVDFNEVNICPAVAENRLLPEVWVLICKPIKI